MFDVLIFDDNAEIADLLAESMSDSEWASPRVAYRVPQALDCIAGMMPPELALVDFVAPNGGGLEVAEAAASRNVPFIFLTGDLLAADIIEDCGLPVLRKPCRTRDIMDGGAQAMRRCEENRERVVSTGAEARRLARVREQYRLRRLGKRAMVPC